MASGKHRGRYRAKITILLIPGTYQVEIKNKFMRWLFFRLYRLKVEEEWKR